MAAQDAPPKRQTPNPWPTIAKVVGPYTVLATLWIVASDAVLAALHGAASALTLMSIAKGLAFVLITSVLLACLVMRHFRRLALRLERERKRRREITKSHALLKSILESLPSAVAARFDDDSSYVCNKPAKQLLDSASSSLVPNSKNGEKPAITTEAAFAALLRRCDADVGGQQAWHAATSVEPGDFEFKHQPILTPAGAVIGELLVGRSISRERRALLARNEAEERYEVLFKKHPLPMWVFRWSDKKIMAVNDAACFRYGYSEEEFLDLDIFSLRAAGEQVRLASYFSELPTDDLNRIRRSGVWVHQDASGQRMEMDITSVEAVFGGHDARLVLAREVTAERRSAAELKLYQQRLSELTQRLMNEELDTARRLSRTLHDGIGHDLFRALMLLDAIEIDKQVPHGKKLSEARLILRSSLASIRDLLADLRSDVLDARGLVPALEELALSVADQFGGLQIVAENSCPVSDWRLPAPVEYAVYIVAREALVNAARHASAGSIKLQISFDFDELVVSVEDDGVGMDLDATSSKIGHLGLQSIIERASGIGATLSIESHPGKGTRIVMRWRGYSDGKHISD